ncbi:MAG TPA: DUF5916 domain-containing protein [Candidatus Saccharimonadales bacterium]|nr:DUF5916 domain-containing protein [Candidatus Saccharimonadales bacterium]
MRWAPMLLLAVAAPGLAQPADTTSFAPPGAPAPAPMGTAGLPRPATAPVIRAARRSSPIRVDGRLDEPAWEAAAPFTDFVQTDPQEGQPASERTEVRVLVDGDALYVGARLFDREPAGIRAHLARRDDDSESDYFEVYLDSFLDRLTATHFRVNAAGAVRDGTIHPNGDNDATWDAVWDAAARVDSLGWTAELRIPLSQLHYNQAQDAAWGVQFARFIHRRQEQDVFAFTPKKETGGVSRYGRLSGLGPLASHPHLELLPYTVGRAEYKVVAAGSPFRSGHDYFGNAGLDLKYDLTRDLSLTATVNPDFGQAEVDPAVVNLSAYETFYPEKRPFFVEGAGYFAFGKYRDFNHMYGLDAVYSRRIGRPPQIQLEGDGFRYVDAPDQGTILGAAKLTGETRGGWSVGALDAVTGRGRARFVTDAGAGGDSVVDAPANFFIGRVRRDLRGGNTSLGAIVTSVNRSEGDPGIPANLRSAAYSAGGDFSHAWDDQRWSLDGAYLQSYVRGSPAAIAATQLNSTHYFQRPDQGHVRFDPTRTSLAGYQAGLALARRGGEHWLGSVTAEAKSPGFEINDIGAVMLSDRCALSTLLAYKNERPGKVFRTVEIYPFTCHAWNYGGKNVNALYALGTEGLLANYWSWKTRLELSPAVYDDQLTRGGPIARTANLSEVILQVSSDSRRPYTANFDLTRWWDDRGGHSVSCEVDLSVRPSPGLQVVVGPVFERDHILAQYVTAVDDPTATATYGRRYVFATLDQTTVSFATRVNWTFSPRVSLQLYLQPLVSAAAYTSFKELRAPASFDFDVYGTDRGTLTPVGQDSVLVDPDGAGPAAAFAFARPDFNYRSLRGNAVLRWEYRPGSTLYLIWQQTRAEQASVGDFDFGRDFQALFSHHPDNIFMLKVTRWFGV